MDKYHSKFGIDSQTGTHHWTLTSHTGEVVAMGSGCKNWHNAKRALDRHVKVIQSKNFTLPTKPDRKPYTFKTVQTK